MSESAHRILILDNDETTGSYYILFSLYDLLALSHFGDKLDSKKTLEILIHSCEEFKIFRPGLRSFLKDIARMKKNGEIEKLCLYTNQLDVRDVYHHPHWITHDQITHDKKTNNGITWSVPLMISKMFCLMVEDDEFIDELYTRPLENVDKINNYPVKDLSRVYKDLYPKSHINLSKTLFIDDLHHKKYIIDSSNSNTDKLCRCPISPYSRQLPKSTFGIIINRILKAHGIELHWHNSILRDSIESSWIHMNSNLKNANTGSSVLRRINERVHKFFDLEYKDNKITNRNERATKGKRNTKGKRSTKGKRRTYHKKSENNERGRERERERERERKRRTRKGRNSSS